MTTSGINLNVYNLESTWGSVDAAPTRRLALIRHACVAEALGMSNSLKVLC